MTRRQSAFSKLPDNNFDSWIDWVESPDDKLIFNLSVIGKYGSLHGIKYYRFIKILTPCGVVHLHTDANISFLKDNLNSGVMKEHGSHYFFGTDASDLHECLRGTAEYKERSSFGVNELPAVGFAARLKRYHIRAISDLFFDSAPPLLVEKDLLDTNWYREWVTSSWISIIKD